MRSIPLVRPLLPSMHTVASLLETSRMTGMYSNFGPNYHLVRHALFKKFNRNMLPVTNGTAAIELACKTVLKKGARVVIPDFTHIGTYAGVVSAGCKPILCRTNEKTWTLELKGLASRVDEFDAFVVVSPFGHFVDIAPYERFAKRHKKTIIYDYAGAWGQFPETDFPVCYSLHATKGLAIGEGGIVSFKSPYLFEKCRVLSNFGIGHSGNVLHVNGSNLKMDEIRLAMLLDHIDSYSFVQDKFLKRGNTLLKYYRLLKTKGPAYLLSNPPSLFVFPGMEKIRVEKFKDIFTAKFYYPLLSRMGALSKVKRFSASGDYFLGCLALPVDVCELEQQIIVELITKDLK